MSRHLIVNITNTKKPHKTDRMTGTTNNPDDLDVMLSEIKTRLLHDDCMLITIQRDCHSEASEE